MEDPNQEESEEKPCILLILSNQTLDWMDVATCCNANASGLIRCADSITPFAETLNNYQISMLLPAAILGRTTSNQILKSN